MSKYSFWPHSTITHVWRSNFSMKPLWQPSLLGPSLRHYYSLLDIFWYFLELNIDALQSQVTEYNIMLLCANLGSGILLLSIILWKFAIGLGKLVLLFCLLTEDWYRQTHYHTHTQTDMQLYIVFRMQMWHVRNVLVNMPLIIIYIIHTFYFSTSWHLTAILPMIIFMLYENKSRRT